MEGEERGKVGIEEEREGERKRRKGKCFFFKVMQ